MRAFFAVLSFIALTPFAHAQGTVGSEVSEIYKPVPADSAMLAGTAVVTEAPAEGYAPRLLWLDFGPALTSRGIGASLNVGFRVADDRFISTRVALESGYQATVSSPAEETVDVGVLYGLVRETPLGAVTLAAGVAGVYGTRVGEFVVDGDTYGVERFWTVGLPVSAQIFVTPFSSSSGMTLQAFANLNTQRPFAGMSVGWVLGN